jgi:hypothetical protein
MKRRIAALLVLALFLSPTAVSPEAGASEEARPQSESAATPGGGGEAEVLEDFVPTEELPADSVISFPVDI